MVEQLNLVDHDDKFAKAAFRLLLNDATPMPMGTLAERIGVEQALVTRVFDHLRLVGRAETDGDRLLGVYGLTLKPTQHRLTLRGSTFFTWCAFDIVGIPAALGESAEIASVCAHCRAVVSFAMTDGEPPSLPLVVSWLSERCDSIRDQFCPAVNFYCDRTHYQAALNHGQAPDSALSLEQVAEMGRHNWGWAR
ncbi:MAG TPA: organomercurial lyase [Dehalococcoidia bacterium]|jgi:alkylmercury lyase